MRDTRTQDVTHVSCNDELQLEIRKRYMALREQSGTYRLGLFVQRDLQRPHRDAVAVLPSGGPTSVASFRNRLELHGHTSSSEWRWDRS